MDTYRVEEGSYDWIGQQWFEVVSLYDETVYSTPADKPRAEQVAGWMKMVDVFAEGYRRAYNDAIDDVLKIVGSSFALSPVYPVIKELKK